MDFRLDAAALADSQSFFFFYAEGSASHRQGQRPVDTESALELGQMACDTTGKTLQNSTGHFRDIKQTYPVTLVQQHQQ